MGEPTSGSGACYSSRLHAHVAHVLLAFAALALPLRAVADTPNSVSDAPAAEVAPAESADSEQSAGLGEVVVSARRHSESGQTVPISIAAFDAAQLQSAGASSTSDLPLLVPGLTLQVSGQAEMIFIRGLGNAAGTAVPIFVDGIYQAYPTAGFVFNNLANVEVDKGPQGTLFGRNSTGGVVQMLTKAPSATPSATVDLSYANYNTVSASLYGTTGIAPGVATDLAFYYNNQSQGWGRNLANNEEAYKRGDLALRSKTRWEISDSANATLTVNYMSTRGSSGADIQLQAAGGPGFLFNEVTGQKFTIPGRFNLDSNINPMYHDKQGGVALRLEDDFGFARAVSITSWQRDRPGLDIDYDGTPIPFFNLVRRDSNAAVTQEFQLMSSAPSRIDWVVGAFYLNTDANMNPFSFGGLGGSIVFGAPEGDAYNIVANQILNSYSVYGQTSINVLPDTKLTLGGRINADYTQISGHTEAGGIITPGTSGGAEETFRRPTFRASLDHNFTHEVLAYVSYNKGYNSGGFNEVSPAGFAPANISAVKPEIVDAYEIGTKTQWLDSKVRANLAGFWYKYQNMQQEVYSNGGLVTLNAAAARIRGVDFDLQARPIPAVTLTLGAEYLDSKYTKYPNAPFYSLAPSGAMVTTEGDATGRSTVSAPKTSGNASINYDVPTPIGDFVSAAAATYSGAWFADMSNTFREPAHTLVNVSETWNSLDGKSSVSLWCKNCGDKYYDVGLNLLTPVGAVGNPGAPRTFGVTFHRAF
jgi:iron complex outermembrane recepter protein